MNFCTRLFLILAVACTCRTHALESQDYAVDVRVNLQPSPPAITLAWPVDSNARQYVIRRKGIQDAAWSSPIATLPGNAALFSDSNVQPGIAYEYEVRKELNIPAPSGWVNAYTYVASGINLPLVDSKGKVLVLVDSTIAGGIAGELASFLQDLVGAGWTPIRRDVNRTTPPPQVRELIRNEYYSNPGLRSVILLGHVPVPYSGNIAPDLHESHRGAWPADLYYADVDGTWTDSSVNVTSEDNPDNNNRPGDGKFDQSEIPSPVDLEIGRIDFWSMPAFAPRSEIDLLRNYLRKNNRFRHRQFTAARRGLVRDNFGELDGDAPAVDAWRHYGGFFGPDSIQEIGPGSFFSTLASSSYLWAYGCGGGGYHKADGVGSTYDFAASDPQAVFLMLHGSYFGDWNITDNFLRGAIASPNYTLASVWTGLPHWFMHHMAIGYPIGASTRVSQNNINTYKSHINLVPAQVHISLIGDPTLELFPVIPPTNLSGSAAGTANLTWNGSPDSGVAGYHVYHSTASISGPYTRLTSTPLSGTSYSHAVDAGTHHYMIRAVKLERSGSASFYTASQGVFTTVNKTTTGGQKPEISITAEDGDADESGNRGSIRLTRNIADSNPMEVELIVGGTATPGIDFEPLPATATIPAGSGSTVVEIRPLADTLEEGDETVIVQIGSRSTYTVGMPFAAVITLRNIPNQPNQAPTLSTIPDISVAAGNSTAEIPFTVGDVESPAGNLTLRARSSDPGVIPSENVTFGGSGANRTLRVAAPPFVSGNAVLTITVSDGSAETSRSFNVTVTHVNAPPTISAIPDQNLAAGSSSAEIPIAIGDPETPAGSLVVTAVSGDPSVIPNSSLTLSGSNGNRFLRISAPPGITGSAAITVTVSDGQAETSRMFTVAVTHFNSAPTAQNQNLRMFEDGHVTIILKGQDPDGDALTYQILAHPQKGLIGGTPPNVTYTPGPDVNGIDGFTFSVRDSSGETAQATVVIEITPVNDAPTATAMSREVDEDDTLAIQLTGMDSDGDPLEYEVVEPPKQGTLTGTAPNLVYAPSANFYGTDDFTFRVLDGMTSSVPARVTISVLPINDPPLAVPVTLTTEEEEALTVVLAGSDSEGDTLSYAIATQPRNGSLTGEPPNLTYSPKAHFYGEDSFTYKVSDGITDSLAATVTITVSPVNDIPIAIGGTVHGSEDEPLPLILSGFDRDNEVLSYQITTPPRNGTLRGVAPNLEFIPEANFSGTDMFSYRVSDAANTFADATITLVIGPVNDSPTAQAQVVLAVEDEPKDFIIAGSDADGDPLSYTITTPPAHGQITGTAPALTYTPNPNFSGSDSFSFTVTDATEQSAPATVAITVTARNDAPTVQPIGNVITRKNSAPLQIPLAFEDADTDAESIITTATSDNAAVLNAAVPVIGTGNTRLIQIAPEPGVAGTALIRVAVDDGMALVETSFEVTFTNTPPVGVSDAIQVTGFTAIPAALLLGNDIDADGDLLQIASVPAVSQAGGTLELQPGGSIAYTPPANPPASDSFTYELRDESGATATATVSVMLPASAPRIDGAELERDGTILLRVNGEPGKTFHVLVSADARTWTLQGDGACDASGDGEYRDPESRDARIRFYRIEWPK